VFKVRRATPDPLDRRDCKALKATPDRKALLEQREQRDRKDRRATPDRTGPQGIQGEKGDAGDTGPEGPQGPQGPVSIFGTEYVYAESLGQSQTNSETFQNKVTLTTGNLPSGTYRIGWAFNWALDASNENFEAEIDQVSQGQLWSMIQEPKDAGNDQQIPASAFIELSLSGVQNFELNYRTSDSNDTAFISDAKIEFWRVS
jgi:hypothetical protein